MGGGDDEIVNGQTHYLRKLVAVFPDCSGVRVLNLRIDPDDEHRLIHGGKRGCEHSLSRMSALFLLAQEQEVDRERDARSEPQKGVDAAGQFCSWAVSEVTSRTPIRRSLATNGIGSPALPERDQGTGLLAQILNEGRLFGCQRGAYRCLFGRRNETVHLRASSRGGNAGEEIAHRARSHQSPFRSTVRLHR